MATPATASRACGYLRTNVLSARQDLKKYTALRFRQEVKRHTDAAGPGEDVVLEPRNPFALRTLGQLLLMKGDAPAALPHLRAAATVAPDDPINLFTYAQGLLAMEGESHEGEADELFKRALRLAPAGELAEKIKNQQRRLADRVMRANAQGQPRMDAVTYLSSALEAYRGGTNVSALQVVCILYVGVQLLRLLYA